MYFTKQTNALILFFFICSSSISLINAQEKKWEVDLKDKLYNVSWIQQANEGTIIAAGDKGLVGLDNNTGEIIWEHSDFKAVDKNSFLNIEGLPLVYFDYQVLASKTRGIILNASNGEILFDSKDEGYKIKTYTTYPEIGAILFEASKDSEQYLMKFSLETWSAEWSSNIGKSKGLFGKAKSALTQSFIKHGPYISRSGKMIFGKEQDIVSMDQNTGEVIWHQEADKKIKALVYSGVNDKIYLGIRKSKKLKVLDPESGNDITPGKLKLRGSMIDVVADSDNNLILVETEGFNLIDPQTETFKWKKSFKIDPLSQVIPFNSYYIAIGKDEKKGSIALVNSEGKKVWDTGVKGYSYYVSPTDNGILYISTERANVLEYKKGKDVWKKDVKFKSIPAVTYDDTEDKVILFENKKGYKFDLSSGNIEQFADDVKLENVNKKTPLIAEKVADGYFLSTPQHASLLTPSGSVKYTKYFDPVQSTGGLLQLAELTGSAALGVDLDIQGSIDNIEKLNSLSNGVYKTAGDQSDVSSQSTALAGYYSYSLNTGNLTTVFEVTRLRYSNSKSTQNSQFILTKNGAGNKSIIEIDKSSGQIKNTIELTDKTPNYVVDEFDNRVFINERNHLISCHQL